MKRIIQVLFLLVGISLIGLGLYFLLNKSTLEKNCTEKATATVVEIIEEQKINPDNESDTGSTELYPLIEYIANDSIVQEKLPDDVDRSKYDLEDEIEILYNPKNVSEFYIKKNNHSMYYGIISIVLGVVFIGVDSVLFVKSYKKAS